MLREISVIKDYQEYPLGSCLISYGKTKVICSCTVEEQVPKFLNIKGKGWISAEYSLLPGSTQNRNQREAVRGKQSPRTVEIQRLISRSLRSVVDLEKLGERSIYIDCDVLQADGGTRCASITGAFIALEIAIEKLVKKGVLKENPIIERLAAVSVGIVNNNLCLDLDYEKDSIAQVDMNIVMTESKKFIEVQGTGEEFSFTREEFNEMLDLAEKGITEIINVTK